MSRVHDMTIKMSNCQWNGRPVIEIKTTARAPQANHIVVSVKVHVSMMMHIIITPNQNQEGFPMMKSIKMFILKSIALFPAIR